LVLIFPGLLLLPNFLVHLIRGVDHGEIRQEIGAIARYLPIVTGVACPRLFLLGPPRLASSAKEHKKASGGSLRWRPRKTHFKSSRDSAPNAWHAIQP
jgi:hypothetical protein